MIYRPAARVLTILELLQAHGRMTGAELTLRLEVDIRIVRNYIQTLADLSNSIVLHLLMMDNSVFSINCLTLPTELSLRGALS